MATCNSDGNIFLCDGKTAAFVSANIISHLDVTVADIPRSTYTVFTTVLV